MNIINDTLSFSQKEKRVIRIYTTLPDGEKFDGIILNYSDEIVCFYSIYDFAFNGIVILSKACIDSVRNDENDDIYSRIIDHNKIIDSFPKEDWITEISSMKQLINNCYNKKIWPIIELIEEGEMGFYIGPITEVGEKECSMFCYDSLGAWEKEYIIPYSQIVKISFHSSYDLNFNAFIKNTNPFIGK